MSALIIFTIMFVLPIIVFFLYILIKSPLFTVQEQQAVIIERLGKFHRAVGPGLHFIWPTIERKKPFLDNGVVVDYVDQHERTLKILTQDIVTKDNIQLQLECITYYQIVDPVKAVYCVRDVIRAINELCKIGLRDVISDMKYEELLKRQDETSNRIFEQTLKTLTDWGIAIRTVKLLSITSLGVIDYEKPLHQGKMQHRHSYFLSYAQGNICEADHIEAVFWRNKEIVLREERELEADDNISKAREELINKVETCIVLWSAQYAGNEQCQHELEYASKQQKTGQNPSQIILITLDETNIPGGIAEFRQFSGKNREQREAAILNLVKEETDEASHT